MNRRPPTSASTARRGFRARFRRLRRRQGGRRAHHRNLRRRTSRRSAPPSPPPRTAAKTQRVDAHYPYIVVPIKRSDLHVDARLSWGVLLEPGIYGTTLTRPDLFARYYEEQISYILKHHEVPVHVGVSNAADPAPLRDRGKRHRHHRGRPARAADAFRAARPLRHRRFDRQRHVRRRRRASRGRSRSSPPSASTIRWRGCSTTPARRRSISRTSCCSPTTSATSTSSSSSAASRSARTATPASSRRGT